MDYEAIFKDNFKAKLEGLMEEHNFKSDVQNFNSLEFEGIRILDIRNRMDGV